MKKYLALLILVSISAIFAACGENSYEPNDVQMYDYNAEPQAYEVVEISDIGRILNTYFDIEAYELGEEQSITFTHAQTGEILTVSWRVIDILGEEIPLQGLNRIESGNVFASETGDVIYVILDDRRSLYIG